MCSFAFKNFTNAYNLQGPSRKGYEKRLESKILPNRVSMQLLLVYFPRIPLPHLIKPLFTLLSISNVSHGPTNRLRYARPRNCFLHIGLVGCGIVSWKPSRYSILRHFQCLCGVCCCGVYVDSFRLLGIEHV